MIFFRKQIYLENAELTDAVFGTPPYKAYIQKDLRGRLKFFSKITSTPKNVFLHGYTQHIALLYRYHLVGQLTTIFVTFHNCGRITIHISEDISVFQCLWPPYPGQYISQVNHLKYNYDEESDHSNKAVRKTPEIESGHKVSEEVK